MSDTLTDAAVAELRYRLSGGLHEPGDAQFADTCTLFNAMIETRPRLVARCLTPDDAVAALSFAAAHDLPVAVRAGGHAVAGKALVADGLVLDVRPMDDIEVDPVTRTARIGGGAIWSAVDAACAAHGLATTGGRVSTTGVAGLTMGGGSGWLERKHGFACDNLVAVELVTAAGEVVRADATQHTELLWALRGGGGNFGVVTAMEFALHPLPAEVLACLVVHRAEDAAAAMRFWRDFMATAPDEVSLGFACITIPEDDDFPVELHNRPAALLCGIYAGDPAEGERVLAEVRAFGEPAADLSGPMAYADFQQAFEDPPGFRNWWTSESVHELPDEAVDALVARARDLPPGPSQLFCVAWGGAIARVDPASAALSGRDTAYVVHPMMLWEDPADDARNVAVGRGFREDVAAWSTGATYLNFVGDETAERVAAGFTDADRVAQVKARYDPLGRFTVHQVVTPAPAAV